MKHNTLKSFSLFLVLVTFLAGGCAEFLNEEPNRAGSAYIYHMDQLYEMTGSPDLYMFYSPGTIGYGKTGSYWDQTIYLNDFYDIAPEMFVYGYGSQLRTYPFYCLDRTEWTESSLAGTNMDNTWTPSWERIYRFNTVIENIDRRFAENDCLSILILIIGNSRYIITVNYTYSVDPGYVQIVLYIMEDTARLDVKSFFLL